ncbi:MAG: HNH endonuclease [Chloroflexi bacterium]|nr:HNH endonuclease [Chloroflexota bacterium]
MTPEKRAAKKYWIKSLGRWVRFWKEGKSRKSTNNSRWVWELENGPIPADHDIHHRDFDKANDRPDNLQCLTVKKHKQLHREHPHIWIDGIEHRWCLDCGYQPISEFWKKGKNLQIRCKPCQTIKKRKWNTENRERVNACQRALRRRKALEKKH